jgi:hypothetical protein
VRNNGAAIGGTLTKQLFLRSEAFETEGTNPVNGKRKKC